MCFQISSSASSSETDAKDFALPFSPNRNIYETRKKIKPLLQAMQFSKRAENKTDGWMKKNNKCLRKLCDFEFHGARSVFSEFHSTRHQVTVIRSIGR